MPKCWFSYSFHLIAGLWLHLLQICATGWKVGTKLYHSFKSCLDWKNVAASGSIRYKHHMSIGLKCLEVFNTAIISTFSAFIFVYICDVSEKQLSRWLFASLVRSLPSKICSLLLTCFVSCLQYIMNEILSNLLSFNVSTASSVSTQNLWVGEVALCRYHGAAHPGWCSQSYNQWAYWRNPGSVRHLFVFWATLKGDIENSQY